VYNDLYQLDKHTRRAKMKITLSNEFHNTETTVNPKAITEGRFKGFYKISASVAKRAKAKLCGINGCTCCGNFGERGGKYVEVMNMDADNNFIVRI